MTAAWHSLLAGAGLCRKVLTVALLTVLTFKGSAETASTQLAHLHAFVLGDTYDISVLRQLFLRMYLLRGSLPVPWLLCFLMARQV